MSQTAVQDNTSASGRTPVAFVGSIARTDTTAKKLFSLPAKSIPLSIQYSSPAASDAGTTATVSVGKAGGTGTEYLATQDVKTVGTGRGQVVPAGPNATLLGQIQETAVDVTGVYAESGGASTTGGPWVVTVLALI
jgi:hypothetical protein